MIINHSRISAASRVILFALGTWLPNESLDVFETVTTSNKKNQDDFANSFIRFKKKTDIQVDKSSTSNLLESVTEWIFAVDSRANIDVLYIDLSKAFDSVVYSKLS